jgi:hypothetical protein
MFVDECGALQGGLFEDALRSNPAAACIDELSANSLSERLGRRE